MRLGSHNLTIALAILLGMCLLSAGTASAQEVCPNIGIHCSSRMGGNNDELRCEANVEGDVADMKLVYQWSISPQAPLKTIPGSPEGMDFDLSSNPNQQFRVTLAIKGLPDGCQNTAQFVSAPGEIETVEPPSPEPTADPFPEKSPPANTLKDTNSLTGTCAESVLEGQTAYFSVNTSVIEQEAKPVYRWRVSGGRIRKGQGTPYIEVDTTDLGGNPLLATARVEGLSPALSVSCKTMIKRIPKAYKLFEISNQNFDEETKQLLRFALRLSIGLEERAFIVAVGRRGQSVEQIKRRAESAREYLVNLCGVDPGRIMGISIGYGKDEALQLWVVQTGAAPPGNPVKLR